MLRPSSYTIGVPVAERTFNRSRNVCLAVVSSIGIPQDEFTRPKTCYELSGSYSPKESLRILQWLSVELGFPRRHRTLPGPLLAEVCHIPRVCAIPYFLRHSFRQHVKRRDVRDARMVRSAGVRGEVRVRGRREGRSECTGYVSRCTFAPRSKVVGN